MKKKSLLIYNQYEHYYDVCEKTLYNGSEVDTGDSYPFIDKLYYTSDNNGNHLVAVYKEKLTLNQQLYLLFSTYNTYANNLEIDGIVGELGKDFEDYLNFVGLPSVEISDIIDIGSRYIRNRLDDRLFMYTNSLAKITVDYFKNLQNILDEGFNNLDIVASVERIEYLFNNKKEAELDSSVIDVINLNDIRVNSVEASESEASVEDTINDFNDKYFKYKDNELIQRIVTRVEEVLQEELSKLRGDDINES